MIFNVAKGVTPRHKSASAGASERVGIASFLEKGARNVETGFNYRETAIQKRRRPARTDGYPF